MYRLEEQRPYSLAIICLQDESPTMDNGVHEQFSAASVFCNDDLLRVLQLAPWRTFDDSKTIVDLPLKKHPDDVLENFGKYLEDPNVIEAQNFLQENFHDSPDEDDQIVIHEPSDFISGPPSFTKRSTSRRMKEFATDLNNRWVSLSRKFDMADEIVNNRDDSYARLPDNTHSSLIPLPHPFFIPGGRFRECYYWDTLWIVYGLLECNMLESAMGVVRNLLYLVVNIGFVPNGTRVYYLNRSQPPVLAEAVSAIFQRLETHDEKRAWLIETIPILEKEYETFMKCRRAPPIDGKETPLCLYRVRTSKPRPESYKEDIQTAAESVLKRVDSKSRLHGPELDTVTSLILDSNQGMMEQMYQDLASGAESGWDFSSRWLGNEKKGLSSIKTSKIIPACLNSMLLATEKLLASFHLYLNHENKSEFYLQAANERSQAMNELMWDPITQLWMDYDIERECHTDCESVAGLMPLWAGCFENINFSQAETLVRSIHESKMMSVGGIATTTRSSHEQWDFPNCWAPLADLVVVGLNKLEREFPGCGAKETAQEIALRTLRSMYLGWAKDGCMHEKYNAEKGDGTRGEGGEYEPQVGFGWTNGVALKFMAMYAEEIHDDLLS